MNSDKEFLYNLIQEKDKQSEKNKTKRFIVTVLSFSVMFFWLFYSIMNNKLIGSIFLSIVCSFFHFFINFFVFNYLIDKSNAENLELAKLLQKYNNLDN